MLSIDSFNYALITRPQLNVMPLARCHDGKRRPPTSRTNDSCSFHSTYVSCQYPGCNNSTNYWDRGRHARNERRRRERLFPLLESILASVHQPANVFPVRKNYQRRSRYCRTHDRPKHFNRSHEFMLH
jgi:hypothetical protein